MIVCLVVFFFAFALTIGLYSRFLLGVRLILARELLDLVRVRVRGVRVRDRVRGRVRVRVRVSVRVRVRVSI